MNEYIEKILFDWAKKKYNLFFPSLSFIIFTPWKEESSGCIIKRNAIFDNNSSINKRSQFPETVSIMGREKIRLRISKTKSLSLSFSLPPPLLHVYTRFNIIREKSAAIEFLLSVESSNSASCQNFHFTEIKKYIISRLWNESRNRDMLKV